MLADRYELPVSTGSAVARDAYVAGVDCVLAASSGGAGQLQASIAADPAFALAHIALARELFLHAEVRPAREAAARARELSIAATVRERSHVDALALAIEGRPVEALTATQTHLALWPRDAMVLAPATGVFGLIGFSGRQQREEELYDLLRGLARYYGGDWWFGTVQAFAACETGRLDEARRLIEASLADKRDSAHGAHVFAHVLYETGEMAPALQYLDGWMPGYDRQGLMHCHLSWHQALAALVLGQVERAWQLYRAGVHPGGAWGPSINVATDAVAFLWRAELAGQPRQPESWREAQAYTQRSFPRAGLPFIDVHSAVAAVAVGDEAALARLLGEIGERLAAGKYPAGGVVPLIAEGFAVYSRGDFNAAIDRLEQALPQTVRIGGSRAQRDLIEHTLLASLLKAARPEAARTLLAGRVGRHPPVLVAGYRSA